MGATTLLCSFMSLLSPGEKGPRQIPSATPWGHFGSQAAEMLQHKPLRHQIKHGDYQPPPASSMLRDPKQPNPYLSTPCEAPEQTGDSNNQAGQRTRMLSCTGNLLLTPYLMVKGSFIDVVFGCA